MLFRLSKEKRPRIRDLRLEKRLRHCSSKNSNLIGYRLINAAPSQMEPRFVISTLENPQKSAFGKTRFSLFIDWPIGFQGKWTLDSWSSPEKTSKSGPRLEETLEKQCLKSSIFIGQPLTNRILSWMDLGFIIPDLKIPQIIDLQLEKLPQNHFSESLSFIGQSLTNEVSRRMDPGFVILDPRNPFLDIFVDIRCYLCGNVFLTSTNRHTDTQTHTHKHFFRLTLLTVEGILYSSSVLTIFVCARVLVHN